MEIFLFTRNSVVLKIPFEFHNSSFKIVYFHLKFPILLPYMNTTMCWIFSEKILHLHPMEEAIRPYFKESSQL